MTRLLCSRGYDARFPYMHWFAMGWVAAGLSTVSELPLPRLLRKVFGRLKLCFTLGFRRRRLLICAGHRIDSVAWPWCYWNEIVPVLWDVWPDCVPALEGFIRRNRVRTLFCTSSQQVEYFQQQFPRLRAIWMPEGIDVKTYSKGAVLIKRRIDVIEYGRQMRSVHDKLVESDFGSRHVYSYQPDGKPWIYPDFESLRQAIADAKIAICYPQCDTSPERAGKIDTLTQRYWECMLSGTLMCGRAPAELIRLCGYNPCINLGDDPVQELDDILENITQYQSLADRNRVFAEANADWSLRIADIRRELQI